MKKVVLIYLGIVLISGLCSVFAGDTSTATNMVQPPSDYIIGPEDVLSISVWQHSDMSMSATVGPDGNITYPLAGTIKVKGFTRNQVRNALTQAISKYYVDPKVNVDIASYSSARVKVLGMVTSPAIYQLRGQNTLVSVLAQAGGPTSSAQLRQVTILRGTDTILVVDLYKILYEGKIALDVPLLPDDTIFVPDNRKTRVFVLGQVNTPGILDMNDHLTVLEAITKSGGYKDGSKLYDVIVVRKKPKKPEILHFNIEREITKGVVPDKDENLQPDDIVFVPRGNIAELNYLLDQTTPALQTIILGRSAYDAIKGTSTGTQVVNQVN